MEDFNAQKKKSFVFPSLLILPSYPNPYPNIYSPPLPPLTTCCCLGFLKVCIDMARKYYSDRKKVKCGMFLRPEVFHLVYYPQINPIQIQSQIHLIHWKFASDSVFFRIPRVHHSTFHLFPEMSALIFSTWFFIFEVYSS